MKLTPETRAAKQARNLKIFDQTFPIENYAPIGCAQCRRCEVVPETNIASHRDGMTVIIFCGRSNRLRPAQFESCAMADPRPARPSLPHNIRHFSEKIGIGNTHRGVEVFDLGDKATFLTEFGEVVLREFWADAPSAWLESVFKKSISSLRKVVRAKGIGGLRANNTRQSLPHPKAVTRAQSSYLECCYNKQDWWPHGHVNRDTEKARRLLERRNYILSEVAKLGPAMTWEQVNKHLGALRLSRSKKRQQLKNKGAMLTS